MDTYRVLHGASSDCSAQTFLPRILGVGQPAIDLEHPTVDSLQERDQVLFFPQKDIHDLFRPKGDANPVDSILACKCKRCRKSRGRGNIIERDLLAHKIVERPLTVLLAILIFIGQAHLIRHFASHDRIDDSSLDSVTEYIRSEENLEKWQELLSLHGIEGFCKFYNSARNLFQPPTFSMGKPTAQYLNTQRMPFLDDQIHDRGSSGKVYRFNIHPDYLDEEIKKEDWYSSTEPPKFARKVLKKSTTNELDLGKERDNLRLFTEQRHHNIVRALFFYEWRAHINFVFPFIEGNLSKLLSGQWSPRYDSLLEQDKSPTCWLWTQMIGVAEGLSVIHNPEIDIFKRHGSRGVGFHFDLKPANILITNKGELKISDFGLSLIKLVDPSTGSYGTFSGGAPRYQPPEVGPIPSPVASSSGRSLASQSGSDSEVVKNKYDIWSYACIIIETVIFIFENDGIESRKRFEKDLDSEPPGQFHGAGKLKKCVVSAMKHICSDEVAGTKTHRFEPWALCLNQLLERMLSIEPKDRPSSREVVKELKELQHIYTTEPDDLIKATLKRATKYEYSTTEYDEVWYKQSNHSFIDMDDISFNWPKISGQEVFPCRLRILLHKERGKIIIMRCYKNPEINTSIQILSRHSAHFIPLSAYDPNMQLSCMIYDKEEYTVRYTFNSEDDLNWFQAAVVQHWVLYKSQLSIQQACMQGYNKQNPDLDSKKRHVHTFQVWREARTLVQEESQGANSQQVITVELAGQQQTRTGFHLPSRSSIARSLPTNKPIIHRLMIFFDKEYINIPLSQGHPRISYGRAGKNSHTIVDYKTSTTIKVQFALRHHKYFFVSRADPKNLVDFGKSPVMPAIPLSPEDLERQANLRTDFVELHFHQPEDAQSFANFVKNHSELSFYWDRCEAEKRDEIAR